MAVLVVAGTVIMLISSLGVIRLPDVYTRAHATTKSSTLGLLCILVGAFIHFLYHHQIVSIRLILGILFVFLTAPVAGHMIIRSAHRAGVPLADISAQDALEEDFGVPAEGTREAPQAGIGEQAGEAETPENDSGKQEKDTRETPEGGNSEQAGKPRDEG